VIALRSLLLVALLAALPRAALACAVCTGGTEDDTRIAFILTTVFLTALPLILVGSLVFYLLRRARSLGGRS
jgi:ABC-type tungstate transport system substrate-binding protein